MEKKRLLELLKSEHNKVDAIGMILSNYTDFGHAEKGGMVSVAQFKKVAECILEWSDSECPNEDSGLNIPVVVVPKGTLCKCGKQYEVYNKLEGTIVCTLCGKDRLA